MEAETIVALSAREPFAHVRSGSFSDLGPLPSQVGSSFNNGHAATALACPVRAKLRHSHMSLISLFDHFIGASEERRRDGEAKRLSRFQIDYQFEFRWHLHWKVGRLLPHEDAIDIAGR